MMAIDFLDSLPGVALDLFIRATILLTIAALVVLLLRRASAAYRHLVWTLALAGVLVQPLLSRITVPWSVSVPLPINTELIPVRPRATPTTPPSPMQARQAAPTVPTPDPIPLWPATGWCVWLGGSVLLVSRLLLGMRRVRQIYAGSALPAGELTAIIVGILSGLSTTRAISVRLAPLASPVEAPMTWGWYRPVILLPASAASWSAEQVRAALLHEVGHIRRADWLIQTGIYLTCALYWWHPLVWWAARQAREESERACDDFVLNAGMLPADYASHLVAAVRALRGRSHYHGAAVTMAQSSRIERRVRATLSEGINRHPVTRRHLAASVGIVVLLLGLFVSLHPAIHASASLGSRNTIAVYYLSTVECQLDQSRPVRVERIRPSNSGSEIHQLTDKRTRKVFHDGAQVTADFARLARRGEKRRAGASSYAVPAEFRRVVPQTTLYLTTDERKQAEGLRTEIRAWQAFLKSSPRILSAADIEPNAVAGEDVASKNGAYLRLTLTTDGVKKFAKFTQEHRKEVIGVIIDPDEPNSQLQTAPNINEAITSPSLQLAWFKTLADAERMAKHLNAR